MELLEVGARFAEERELLGYSQASFARLLGISRAGLINIEQGKSDFKVAQLIAAASAGIDVQYVVTGIRSTNTKKVKEEIGFEKQAIHGTVSGVGFAASGAQVQIIHTQNHRTTVKAETKPGSEHITTEQRAILLDLVNQVVEKEQVLRKTPKSHRAVWAALNKHMGVPSYSLIAFGGFDKARSYLTQWIGGLNAMKSAPIKDGVAWRNSRLKALHANVRGDSELEEKMRSYMKRKFDVTSLADLPNEHLEETYRYIVGVRSRRK